jgi:hypothetical protein
MITLRFDMRAPAIGATPTELYGAAVDMCSWAETHGAIVADDVDRAWGESARTCFTRR